MLRKGDNGGDLGGVSGRADFVEGGDSVDDVGSFGTEMVIKVSTSLELTTFSRASCE